MLIKSLIYKCLFCCLLLLPACSCAHYYTRPPLFTAEKYPRAECAQQSTNIRQFGWKDFFNDPALQQLIILSLNHNRDLRAAIHRMNEVKALYGLQCSEQLPAPNSTLPNGSAYRVVSWEVDFWVRLKSLKSDELEEYLATQEAQHATFISLIGQVANTYLVDCELNELIAITEKTLAFHEESARIMRCRLEEGADPRFDFLQAEALLQAAQTELKILQRKRELNWNAMTVLVGIPICSFNNRLCEIMPYFIKDIHPGLPSDLLYNRPDVRSAEHKLIAINAKMGKFPFFHPILIARRNLAAAEYERTIQVAFREVADALAEQDLLDKQVNVQEGLAAVQSERARVAWTRFHYSSAPFFEVIDAEREKFSAEQACVQTLRSYLASRVNLYIALGGGS